LSRFTSSAFFPPNLIPPPEIGLLGRPKVPGNLRDIRALAEQPVNLAELQACACVEPS
jgi:hypothetical protein